MRWTSEKTLLRLSILGAIFAAGGLVVVFAVPYWAAASRSGPKHVYVLTAAPKFLTEDVALRTARQALTADGIAVSVFDPFPDDRSKAPDGTPDKFIVRNVDNPNRAWVMFMNHHDYQQRIVDIELVGDRVECVVTRPE